MSTIKIGDKVCEFEGQKTILQVALENDIEIPHYCYHPGLTIVASCRICLAEVAQPHPKTGELSRIPKLVPTCQHPAVDGAEVYLTSEKTIANRKAVMEYLLINHPLDCPVCDQAGECLLQDYSYDHGRAFSRFEETKIKQPKKDIGPHVLLYSDRCIMCDRCVRFTKEVAGTGELGRMNRGNRAEIDVFPGTALDNELSGNVVDICPVGALLDKDFLFEQRVWFLKSAASIDGLTASGDNIWLEHNEGRIWRTKPRQNDEVNKWWISDEIRYGWKFVHDPRRLTEPMWKQGHSQVEVDWDTAYREVIAGVNRMERAGKRLAVMISPMLACEEAYLLAKTVRMLDPEAVLSVGPIPREGEDKTFPGGYTIYAEKAPNARGVRRALEQVADGDAVLDHTQFLAALADDDDNIGAVMITGNYPSAWATTSLIKALGNRLTLQIDTLPNVLSGQADMLLPTTTWAEKSGTFENIHGRLQVFESAIPPIEFARPEGQIALDLLAAANLADPQRYDAAKVREEMGGVFVTDVHAPTKRDARKPEMEYVEL